MEEIFGYFGALLIGLVLGLTGGGGSILTVPVLVYLLGINPVIATAYSLFIVGSTSTFGSILNYRKGLVEVKTGLKFAIPSLIAIYFTRKFIVPAIPEVLFKVQETAVTKDFFIMVLLLYLKMCLEINMDKYYLLNQPLLYYNICLIFLCICYFLLVQLSFLTSKINLIYDLYDSVI